MILIFELKCLFFYLLETQEIPKIMASDKNVKIAITVSFFVLFWFVLLFINNIVIEI